MAAALEAALARQRAFVADASHSCATRSPRCVCASNRSPTGSAATRSVSCVLRSARATVWRGPSTRLLGAGASGGRGSRARQRRPGRAARRGTSRHRQPSARAQRHRCCTIDGSGDGDGHGSPDTIEYALDVVLDDACDYAARIAARYHDQRRRRRWSSARPRPRDVRRQGDPHRRALLAWRVAPRPCLGRARHRDGARAAAEQRRRLDGRVGVARPCRDAAFPRASGAVARTTAPRGCSDSGYTVSAARA